MNSKQQRWSDFSSTASQAVGSLAELTNAAASAVAESWNHESAGGDNPATRVTVLEERLAGSASVTAALPSTSSRPIQEPVVVTGDENEVDALLSELRSSTRELSQRRLAWEHAHG